MYPVMISGYDLKIVFYLTFILTICLLPVYLYRRSWKEVGIVACVIIYFFILNNTLIWGKLGVYHDTRMSYENILTIFKQWLNRGIPIGWNPYMNAGEPLYLFSNFFLWSPWVVFCWINKFVNLDSHALFNLFWVFLFVNFSIGSFLLFLILYEDFKASLFCFITLLMSGMFIVNLGQAAGLSVIYYFPFILLCIILSCKRKDIYGIALASLFLGIAINHYLPNYIFLGTSVFIFFILVFNLKLLPWGLRLLKSHYKIIFLALIFCLLLAAPALFLYVEMQDYVSPTRGSVLPGGAIAFSQAGAQPSVNAPLWGYRVLLEQSTKYLLNIHHAFYFGIIPLLLIAAAFLRWRNKYIWTVLASAVVLLFLSTGNDFWGYRLLIKYVPGFNMLRHSFGLAQFVSFFLICLSGYGFRELLREDSGLVRNLKLTILILVSFGIMVLISQKYNVILFGSLGALALIFLCWAKQISSAKIKNAVIKQFYLLVMFLLFMDLTLFFMLHYKTGLLRKPPAALANIVYPVKRTFYPLVSYPLPIDISPLIFKKASLTHSNDNFILFRHRRLDDMLKLFIPQKGHEQVLGVNGPIIYFSPRAKILPEDTPKEQFIKAVYEDSIKQPSMQTRSVFFSEKDIDFYGTDNREASGGWTSEYSGPNTDPNKLGISIEVPEDGFLVRLENFHPNWHAFIDGKKSRIYRANYAFQAIKIPKGKHEISFRFLTRYPFLFYSHIFCVFLTWVAFNFYLYRLNLRRHLKSH